MMEVVVVLLALLLTWSVVEYASLRGQASHVIDDLGDI